MGAFRHQAHLERHAAVQSFLFSYALQPGPPEKLPAGAGLLEAAEEHGLLWVLQDGDYIHRLPNDAVWGEFPSLTAAIQAVERAVDAASGLLGYPVRLNRRMVTVLDRIPRWQDEAKPVNPKLMGLNRFETSRLHQLFDPPTDRRRGW